VGLIKPPVKDLLVVSEDPEELLSKLASHVIPKDAVYPLQWHKPLHKEDI
jgi:hypothetical protein